MKNEQRIGYKEPVRRAKTLHCVVKAVVEDFSYTQLYSMLGSLQGIHQGKTFKQSKGRHEQRLEDQYDPGQGIAEKGCQVPGCDGTTGVEHKEKPLHPCEQRKENQSAEQSADQFESDQAPQIDPDKLDRHQQRLQICNDFFAHVLNFHQQSVIKGTPF